MTREFIILNGTEDGFELLAACEEALYAREGRPHWGQFNILSGGRDLLRSLYPELEKWEDVHRTVNASGVFDSPFTRRLGIARCPKPAQPS